MAHRLILTALSAFALLGCQAEETFEGQETLTGLVEVEAEPVDLDVLSAWTDMDTYGSSEFIDAQAIVKNNGDYTATFTVTLTMINEIGANSGRVEGEYAMTTEYVLNPGEELEVYEGILDGPMSTGTCSWQVSVAVVDDNREDIDRANNKATSNTFSVGG